MRITVVGALIVAGIVVLAVLFIRGLGRHPQSELGDGQPV
jgi:hypothetical protein